MPKKKKQAGRREKPSSPIILFIRRRILFLSTLAILILLLSTQLTLTQDFRTGKNVLGEEESSGKSQELQKEQEQPRSETERHVQDQNREQPQNSGNSAQITNIRRTETEMETRSGVRIKTKVEDSGSRKTETEAPGVRFKFEAQNGEVQLKVEDETGEEIRTHEREREELEQELEDEDIEIATEDGQLVIERNSVRARTNFPLSIDPLSHQLIVITPAGEKAVAILPDVAVQNVLANGFLSQIASGSGTATSASPAGSLAGSVEISLHNGNLVYQVEGKKEQKLLGLIPINTPQTLLVSAQSGEVIAQTQSFLAALLNLFSF